MNIAAQGFSLVRLREAFRLGGLTWRELCVRLWERILEHELMTRASAVSFYAMLALVPFLAIIITIAVQLLPDVSGMSGERGVGNLTVTQFETTTQELFPAEAYEIFKTQIERMQKEPPVGLLSIGLVVALWTSSSLFLAIIDSLNVILGVKETRSIWKLRLVAFGMTILQAVIFLGSLVLIVVWPMIMRWIGLDSMAAVLATLTQWLIITTMVVLTFALTYYVGPDAEQRWEWITPGSLIGTGIFLVFSYVFRIYIENFANYDKTYGSLGGVMVLLFWFWVTSLVVLGAAQMNKIIEDASPLGKKFGQKAEVPDLATLTLRPEENKAR